ncbi:NAD-dependent epimerase/dehydratase family protein [Nocardioides piscis]|uniref:NAD-dependent epimerase/dehydratase family protein n=1 Tax=Nocardioides piscis TaxID=2714938 RepID=A0A6G7YEV9_9ACTN|nr:NAD-dependent epimerase/dehydratase family protein [Nocardioides piscis]QIK75216.1 NAD-dependent epimerase/dehydratase family protein [Nocardioides piscis]
MRADVLVAGGGGFIGGHLVGRLLAEGRNVRSVDVKPVSDWHQVHADADNQVQDLSLLDAAMSATEGVSEVYMLAADMGGMGFIENNKAACMLSVLTSTHMLTSAQAQGVERYFYSSSACVYPAGLQDTAQVTALKEADAYPAMPEDGYGWEKLFSERMCRHFLEDFGLETRVGRYHNVYGPHGTWEGGREKAPAAVCRKIALAAITGHHELEIWGDGEQTRSFTYIDDCLQGTDLVMRGTSPDPVNIGSAELVTVNQLVDIVEQIAGITCTRSYRLDAPLGVRGRNSDNTLIEERYGWAPSTTLLDGLETTYAWVHDQLKRSLG